MSRRGCRKFLTILIALVAPGQCPGPEFGLHCARRSRRLGFAQETIKLPPPIWQTVSMPTPNARRSNRCSTADTSGIPSAAEPIVSPILLKIADDDHSADEVGRRVDLYFVPFGSLDKLGSENFLIDHLNIAAADNSDIEGKSTSSSFRTMTSSSGICTRRNRPPTRVGSPPTPTLLDKVRISATTQNVKTQTGDSVTVASVFDSKFDQDAEYPNTWRPITIDDAGHRQVGAPQPYAGLGSYIKVTRLAEPTGALFIEYHVVFAEPQGWFHGANLLRSKLPIVAQDMVRTLRRYLEKH